FYLVKLRAEHAEYQHGHVILQPFSDYLCGLSQLAGVPLPRLLEALWRPGFRRITVDLVRKCAALAKEIGMGLLETELYLRLDFARFVNSEEEMAIVARFRAEHPAGDLADYEPVLRQIESSYGDCDFAELKNIQVAIRNLYQADR